MEVSPARGPGTVMNLGRLFRGPLGCREFLRVDDFSEALRSVPPYTEASVYVMG